MPYTNKIIDFIDSRLKATSFSDKRFTGKHYGLMQSMMVKNSKGESLFGPAKPNLQGEMEVAYPDDTHALITYHKIISVSYSNTKPAQYGDRKNFLLQTSDVALNIIGFSDQLQLLSNDLEGLVAPGIPADAKELARTLGFNNILISPLASRFDSQAIFNEEFRGTDFKLKPNMIVFQVKYRIESEFRKDCFKICAC